MTEMIEVALRVPDELVPTCELIGSDGIVVLVDAHLMGLEAQALAGHDDEGCFARLLEMHYRIDLVTNMVLLKLEVEKLAQADT